MADPTPTSSRPRGGLWRALQTEGIAWEGQVAISGESVDLPVRLIVTHQRLVFVRGGQIMLEMPRDWLRPAPYLGGDGSVHVQIDATGQGCPERIRLVAKEGRRSAAHLVSLVGSAGVRATRSLPLYVPEQIEPMPPVPMARHHDAEPRQPRWQASLSAYAILDPDDFPPLSARPPASHDDVGSASAPREMPNPQGYSTPPPSTVSGPAMIPAAAPPSSTERHRTWNLDPLPTFSPKSARRSRTAFAIRLSGLVLLLVTAAAFGSGRFPSLPGEEERERPSLAGLQAPFSEGVTATAAPDVARAGVETDPTIAAAMTSEAIGVGGLNSLTPPSSTPTLSLERGTAEPTQRPTARPTATSVPEQGIAGQPASVDQGDLPAQAFANAGMYYTVAAATRDGSFPELGLGPIDGIEWVVIALDAHNWSESEQSVSQEGLFLFASGPSGAVTYSPDPTSGLVGQSIGLDGAGAGSPLTLPPGESGQVALAYAVGAGGTFFELVAGTQLIDLANAFGRPVDLATVAGSGRSPDLVEARVVAIIDGRTIEVEADGERTTVRYIGIEAPREGDCFASDATAANAALVEGATVWLERQRRNKAGSEAVARDVWLAAPDGGKTLVAAELAAQGVVGAKPSSPDLRYAGWIAGAAAAAQYNGLGLWSACGGIAPGE